MPAVLPAGSQTPQVGTAGRSAQRHHSEADAHPAQTCLPGDCQAAAVTAEVTFAQHSAVGCFLYGSTGAGKAECGNNGDSSETVCRGKLREVACIKEGVM